MSDDIRYRHLRKGACKVMGATRVAISWHRDGHCHDALLCELFQVAPVNELLCTKVGIALIAVKEENGRKRPFSEGT